MKLRKKLFTILFVFFLLNIAVNVKIMGASINGTSEVSVDDVFTVTFEFGTNVGAFDELTVSYDENMLTYVSGDSLSEKAWFDSSDAQEGITSKTYTFKAINSGISTIRVVANGVVGADEGMSVLGNMVAEKTITVLPKETAEEPHEEEIEPPKVETPKENAVLSSNNYLRRIELSVDGLTPAFSRNILNYSLAVGKNVTRIDVLARSEDTGATVTVTGNENIVDGDNYVYITVKAQNGVERTYTILVTKSENIEDANAFLETLIVENYNLDKEFQSEVFEYNLGDISSIVKSINIVAIAKDERANIEIIGADNLKKDGEIVIKVTGADGVTVREYKLKYNYVTASTADITSSQMNDYLKEVQNSKNSKEKVVAYLKYLLASIKKNIVLVLMYILVIFEFIIIVILRNRLAKSEENNNNNNGRRGKDILKVDIPSVEPPEVTPLENNSNNSDNLSIEKKIEPPEIKPLNEENNVPVLEEPLKRHGNISKADGIKLVDLDNDTGPQDELTFNIFENLKDEDIKKLLNDEINNDDEK